MKGRKINLNFNSNENTICWKNKAIHRTEMYVNKTKTTANYFINLFVSSFYFKLKHNKEFLIMNLRYAKNSLSKIIYASS